MKVIAIVALTALTTSCSALYDMQVKEWLGATRQELVAAWGPPSEVRILNESTEEFIYRNDRGMMYLPGSQMPGHATTTIIGNTAYTTYRPGPTMPGIATQMWCETEFQIVDDQVVYYRFRGNNCNNAPDRRLP